MRERRGVDDWLRKIFGLLLVVWVMIHHDRNSHITCNIFHCCAMISSFAKVVGLQSPVFSALFLENGHVSTD